MPANKHRKKDGSAYGSLFYYLGQAVKTLAVLVVATSSGSNAAPLRFSQPPTRPDAQLEIARLEAESGFPIMDKGYDHCLNLWSPHGLGVCYTGPGFRNSKTGEFNAAGYYYHLRGLLTRYDKHPCYVGPFKTYEEAKYHVSGITQKYDYPARDYYSRIQFFYTNPNLDDPLAMGHLAAGDYTREDDRPICKSNKKN